MNAVSGRRWGAVLFWGLAFTIFFAGGQANPGKVALLIREVDAANSYALVEFTNGSPKQIAYTGTVRAPDCFWIQSEQDESAEDPRPWGQRRTLAPGDSVVFWTRVPETDGSRIGVTYWQGRDGGNIWQNAPRWFVETFPGLQKKACHHVKSPVIGQAEPDV